MYGTGFMTRYGIGEDNEDDGTEVDSLIPRRSLA